MTCENICCISAPTATAPSLVLHKTLIIDGNKTGPVISIELTDILPNLAAKSKTKRTLVGSLFKLRTEYIGMYAVYFQVVSKSSLISPKRSHCLQIF